MKRKQVWRYYCDFCKKSGCSAYHLKKHEAGCTANPNRICSFCRIIGDTQKPIAELIAALISGPENNYKAGLVELMHVADECPACVLAAIRQSGVQRDVQIDSDGLVTDKGCHIDYDFKAAVTEFWNAQNANNR